MILCAFIEKRDLLWSIQTPQRGLVPNWILASPRQLTMGLSRRNVLTGFPQVDLFPSMSPAILNASSRQHNPKHPCVFALIQAHFRTVLGISAVNSVANAGSQDEMNLFSGSLIHAVDPPPPGKTTCDDVVRMLQCVRFCCSVCRRMSVRSVFTFLLSFIRDTF